MGSVKVSFHPSLLLAPAGAGQPPVDSRRCRHAALWLSVVIEPWHAERSGHLHLLQEPGESSWREVDLTRHPLRVLPEQPEPPDLEGLVANLRQTLAGRTLSLFRIPEIGLVSEIGEGREDFRRRATGALRPQLQRRLAADQGGATRERMASELASLASSIETIQLGDFGLWVRRVELGVLLVAPEVRLEAPRFRPLMI
jgi:hypothetical protein